MANKSSSLQKTLKRLNATLRNGLEVARFGGLKTDEEPSPYKVKHQTKVFRLRHYFPDRDLEKQPVLLLVPPLMLHTEVYDMSESVSSVRQLNKYDVETWVVDFGAPEVEEDGWERSLTDHVLAVSECIDLVAAKTGRPVHVGGYSQGGMFCYMAAAYRKSEGLASVITFGSPVDMSQQVPDWLPAELVQKASEKFAQQLLSNRGLPGWLIGLGFQGLDPIATLRHRIKFITQLHNREALLPYEGQRRFIEGEGFVGYAGPAIAELMSIGGAANRLMSGGFDFLGQTVTLADITCPVLCFISPADSIATPASVRGIRRAAPLANLNEVGMTGGHMGLVCSSAANELAWPAVADWARWQNSGGKEKNRPDRISQWNEAALADSQEEASDLADSASLAVEMLGELGLNAARSVRRSSRTAGQLIREAREALPQLFRLEAIRDNSQISMAELLQERGKKSPANTAFLFDGRSHSYAAVNERIDNIVRGLISVGVRRGEHVGVLMNTRPSAITLVAAINRLGAIAVLLRPDGEPAQELRLGNARRLVTDPESAPAAVALNTLQVLVLGGGSQERDLTKELNSDSVIDMERIDPSEVNLPDWYRPNPGLARELAFILFTGKSDGTRANRVTNGRWALSAFGTASAAAIDSTDTVFGTTMHYHPSGLLTTFGAAIAGGGRLALTDKFRPDTFWDEVRRYGVTVVSYTWTSLHSVVNAPTHPLEASTAVRLLMGSGMPLALWQRARDRFAPAGILEFYASTEGEAVLANIDGGNAGAKGHRLPGSARLKLAAYDIESRRLKTGEDGYAVEVEDGETGMLLVQAKDGNGSGALRGLFAPDDAWRQTGDLFQRNEGEYWFAGSLSQLLQTPNGPVAAVPAEDALGRIDGVDLALGYLCNNGKNQQFVMAITTVEGYSPTATELNSALADVPTEGRPWRIHCVKEIPSTSWYRLTVKPSWRKAAPTATASLPVFELQNDGRYKKLSAAKPKTAK